MRSPLTYRDLADEAVRGGWPGLLEAGTPDARTFTTSYLSDLTSTELRLATGVTHDPIRLRRLLVSLARNVATEATVAKLAADVGADSSSVDRGTIRTYLDALTRVFAIEDQEAWSPDLRSRTRLRRQPKLHFADASLACAGLRLAPDRLARDSAYFGAVVESMAVHDLRTYVEAVLARSDSAGATHTFAAACRKDGVEFSFGFPVDFWIKDVLDLVQDDCWHPAIETGVQEVRDGA